MVGMAIFVSGVDAGVGGVGFVLGVGTLAAVYGSLRAWHRARVRRKSRTLTRLLDRLADLVRDYDAPALPGQPPSPTSRSRNSGE
jgi:hypothetical protein